MPGDTPIFSDKEPCRLFEKHFTDEKKLLYEISFSDLNYGNNAVILGCIALQIKSKFDKCGVDLSYILDYNGEKIIFYKVGEMAVPYKYTIEIPYASHAKYLPFVKEIASKNLGMDIVELFVSNNPYDLKVYLVVETQKNHELVEQLIAKFGLTINNSKGLTEFFQEMGSRKWNSQTIPSVGDDEVELIYQTAFVFADISDLESKGCHIEMQAKRQKLFISYCHANKEWVSKIVSELKSHGLYYWWDEQEIDVGDSILDKILSGFAECDLAVVFISKFTAQHNYAKFELRTFWDQLIQQEKPWFIVRLDDVEPSKIYMGLSGYKYYDCFQDQDIEGLVEMLHRKTSKIQ